MHTAIPRRVGVILLVFGLAGIATAWLHDPQVAWSFPIVADPLVVLAGVALLTGRPRVALVVRLVAAFLLGVAATAVVAALVIQPIDLTWTELRLEPASFAWPAAVAAAHGAVLLWLAWELGRRPVLAAIATAGRRRWEPETLTKFGLAAGAVMFGLFWITLHGQSATLAESLAEQQIGPAYRYALTSMRTTRIAGRAASVGVVTAWNGTDIKRVVLHWEGGR